MNRTHSWLLVALLAGCDAMVPTPDASMTDAPRPDGATPDVDGAIGEPVDAPGETVDTPPAPDAPTARFELEARDLTVSLDDAGSEAVSGAIVGYAWDFGDGETAAGPTPPLHVYGEAGTYDITLTVTDDAGVTGSSTQSVSVAARSAGSYAPADDTTGVPDVVRDRLHLLDLEAPDKRPGNIPTVAAETLVIRRVGEDWTLEHDGTAIELDPEHAYVDGDRFVLDRLHIRGYVQVRAPNVTIRRSIVEAVSIPEAPESAPPAGVDEGRRLIRGNDTATIDLRLEDLEVRVPAELQRGAGINDGFHHGIGVEASRATLLRSEVTGTVDGLQIHAGSLGWTDVLVERSWLHDLAFYERDDDRTLRDATHSDGVQVECSMPHDGAQFGVRIAGNVIDMTSDPNLNAAIQITSNACHTQGLLITENFLDGAVFPINVGSGDHSSGPRPITLYVNGNRFGPNRPMGMVPDKTWAPPSFTARVMAVKSNNDGLGGYENYGAARTQHYVYFSFDPPARVGEMPPTGELDRNTMVDHERTSSTWGTVSRGSAGLGFF